MWEGGGGGGWTYCGQGGEGSDDGGVTHFDGWVGVFCLCERVYEMDGCRITEYRMNR